MTNFMSHPILRPSYIPTTAWLRHGPFAMWLVAAMRPRQVVELGSHYGYSYFSFCEAVRHSGLDTRCIAVDTWAGDEHAGFYGEEVFERVQAQNTQYETFSTLLRKTFEEALDDVEDGSVDLLHIDGRHFYDDVKYDYESWVPKLAKNAIVLFHDTEVRERGFGVWKFWEELAAHEKTFNFSYQYGLGVLFRGGDVSPELAAFRTLTQDSAGRDAITALFLAEGADLAADYTQGFLVKQFQKSRNALAESLDIVLGNNLSPENQLSNPGPGGAAMATALSQAATRIESITAKLDATTAERDQLIANTNALQAHLLDQQTETMGLRTELAQLRRKPGRVLREHVIYRVLTKLASGRLPISDRAQARFARSAHKRDPNRSLNTGQTANSQPAPLSPIASQAARPYHLQTLQGHIARDPERRNVLVLAHEASFTGAPILAQNVMRVLAERYNVYAISIRGGELVAPFLECTVETMIIGSPPDPASSTYRKVKSFITERNIEFGIANSIEVRYLLPILNELDIASVSLIHEFASYAQQKHAYRDAVSLSDEVIFSTQLTLDNAADEASVELSPYIHVLPQGKCVVPGAANDANTHELLRLKAYLRPPGHEDDFLVIGAGYVHFRKGVDLFIEVARHAQAQAGGRALRFVWIGDGYDPDNEMAFCVFLRDQMKRSGVQDIVHFIPATTEIDQAYDMADLLLVPSRLDPLPNVAIDAMLSGTPVLCFEKATGIANVLAASGIADVCVADYMDTADMTGKLLALAQSPDLYADIAIQTQSHAQEVFDLPAYVNKVETLALAARDRKHSKIGDASIIAAEPLFDPAYVIPPHHDLLTQRSSIQRLDVAKAYLDTLSKSNWARRPEPGFNPHIYAQHMRDRDGEVTSNPYADFLEQGRPKGPWLLPVLSGGEDVKLSETAATQRVALHIHAYYTDMMAELLDKLALNQSRPDLHITVCHPEAQANLQEVLARYDGTYTVYRVPNIGRDIGPFLTDVGPQLMRDYDIIGHVHTKKSIALSNDTLVENWTQFVFENTLGGTKAGAMIDRALNAFATDPKLGIVFPADPNVLNWARNRLVATEIAEKIGISALPELFDFPVGTMFWSRADAIRPLIDLGLTSKDYPQEPIGIDGTILHALERLFGIVPVWQGYSAAVTATPGLTR